MRGTAVIPQIQREHVRELREQLQRDGRRPRHHFNGKVSTRWSLEAIIAYLTEQSPITPFD